MDTGPEITLTEKLVARLFRGEEKSTCETVTRVYDFALMHVHKAALLLEAIVMRL